MTGALQGLTTGSKKRNIQPMYLLMRSRRDAAEEYIQIIAYSNHC